MKIIAISTIKNADVYVESFVRYTLSFADMLLVFNHNSTDGTEVILNSLMEEDGDRIKLYSHFRQVGEEFPQAEITNAMLAEAIDIYGADLVIPLDADEFPLLTNERHVTLRDYLHSLPQSSCYCAHWLPFAPSVNTSVEGETFLPLNFTISRSSHYHLLPKCILTKACYEADRPSLSVGNHTLLKPSGEQYEKINDLSPKFCYAHYPCTSKKSIEAKISHGWLACLADSTWTEGIAISYKQIYDRLAAGESIPETLFEEYCLKLGEFNKEPDSLPKATAVERNSCELFPAVNLRYGSYVRKEQNAMQALMNTAEKLAVEYREVSKELETIKQINKMLLRHVKDNKAISSGETGKTSYDYSLVFDSKYYLSKNPDVYEAYNGDGQKALQHFILWGMDEGRASAPWFNVRVYMEKYPELKERFGNNYRSYYLHYIEIGIYEGKTAMYL